MVVGRFSLGKQNLQYSSSQICLCLIEGSVAKTLGVFSIMAVEHSLKGLDPKKFIKCSESFSSSNRLLSLNFSDCKSIRSLEIITLGVTAELDSNRYASISPALNMNESMEKCFPNEIPPLHKMPDKNRPYWKSDMILQKSSNLFESYGCDITIESENWIVWMPWFLDARFFVRLYNS